MTWPFHQYLESDRVRRGRISAADSGKGRTATISGFPGQDYAVRCGSQHPHAPHRSIDTTARKRRPGSCDADRPGMLEEGLRRSRLGRDAAIRPTSQLENTDGSPAVHPAAFPNGDGGGPSAERSSRVVAAAPRYAKDGRPKWSAVDMKPAGGTHRQTAVKTHRSHAETPLPVPLMPRSATRPPPMRLFEPRLNRRFETWAAIAGVRWTRAPQRHFDRRRAITL